MNPRAASRRRPRRLSRMKIRFLFEVCGTRTFFMTASCHQRAARRMIRITMRVVRVG